MFTEEEKVQIVNKAIEAAGQALYMASECTGAKNFIDGTMTFDDGKEHWQLQFYKLQPGVFEQMKLSSLKQLDLHHKAQLQQPDVSGSLPLDPVDLLEFVGLNYKPKRGAIAKGSEVVMWDDGEGMMYRSSEVIETFGGNNR